MSVVIPTAVPIHIIIFHNKYYVIDTAFKLFKSRYSNFKKMSNYFGLDFSTQKLKAVVVDDNLKIIHESEVHFDSQLPEYRTQGGVIKGEKGVVTSPVLLWTKALDLLLDQMQLGGVNFFDIKAISGTAQQHGSVYWQKGARETLQNLDSSHFLHHQLQGSFSLKQSPIWMDSSTTAYCKEMENAIGGPEKMADITGSRAYERFTGPQIAKIIDTKRNAYDSCERISLISSFACSLLLGDYADVDYADASGMNLMDLKSKEWNSVCLNSLKAPDVESKLGKPVPPHTNLGEISKYFVERFGFRPDCQIVSFTGDNPASLAGMRLGKNDIAVSLGTSDTIILSLPEPKTFINGHVLCSPTDPNGYMGLLCFKNGSLTRERIRDLYAQGSWEEFEKLLDSTPRGNFGNVGLYFDNQEILPFLKPGDYRWNSKGEKVIKFASAEIEIRALIEGQFLARRAFAEEIGLNKSEECKIIATGGASNNKSVLQVLSDVFNIPVYVQECGNSAVLGSAYLAKLSLEPSLTYQDIINQLPEPILACTPNKDAAQIYDSMLKRYNILIQSLLP